MKRLKLLVLFLFGFCAQAQRNEEKLNLYLDSIGSHEKMWGHVEVYKGNDLKYQKSMGFANKARMAKLDAYSIFKIGSVTKTFTAVIALQLADEGKLTLDQKVSNFYPELENSDKMTLRHLLSHKSGIPSYTDDSLFLERVAYPINQRDLIQEIIGLGSNSFPGIEYEYSNSNYFLLGDILEKVTGESFKQLLQNRIIKPLGLNHTFYESAEPKGMAESYLNQGDSIVETLPKWDMSWAKMAGGILSNCKDMASFNLALFEGNLLSKKGLKEMTDFTNGTYALGIGSFPFHDKQFFGHSGGIESYSTLLGYNVKDKTTYCATVNLTNSNDFTTNDLAIAVLSAYYQYDYQPPGVQSVAAQSVPLEILKNYEGLYTNADFLLDLKIFEQGGRLFGQATGQGSFPLNPISETKFTFEPAKIKIEFLDQTNPPKMKFKQYGNVIIFEQSSKP